ncbi:receptor-like protein 34 [Hibiscus syriacus]|uniref:receptor-like protein 34 n=1 Tax=Hibiscus syriacus TaxID=106335 RepID=UPI0019236EF9|nr:receptor-like protein 34 [Hibiscus syriacus]
MLTWHGRAVKYPLSPSTFSYFHHHILEVVAFSKFKNAPSRCTSSQRSEKWCGPSFHCSGSCLNSWDFSIDPCDNIFTCGLTCDTLVSGLLQVSDSFSNLTRLGQLGLSWNSVTGEIPAVLGSLPHLQELYLDNNHLYGPIPSSFNNLKRLKRLEIQWNYISCEFPDLGSLRKFYFLDASDNNVSGQVPSTLSVSLFELSLKNNIPDNIGKIRFLQVLDLSHSMLYDAISPIFFKHRNWNFRFLKLL